MKRNRKLILLMDTIAFYRIAMWKDADILKVTVATVLCKHFNNSDAVKPIQYPKII